MAFSRVTIPGDGITKIFTVNFALGYLSEEDVTCRVGTEADGLGNPLYRDIEFLSANLLEISGAAPGVDVPVVFERTVPKTQLKVDFSNGDILDEINLDTAQKQIMMSVHEVLDGRLPAFTANVGMSGFKITDLGNPTDPGDAVPLSFVGNAPVHAAAAAASAVVAAQQAALADADRVQTNADRVQTGLDRAACAQSVIDAQEAVEALTPGVTGQALFSSETTDEAQTALGAGVTGKQAIAAGNAAQLRTAAGVVIYDAASQAQAEAGTDNTTALTPLRGKQLVVRERRVFTSAPQVITSAGNLTLAHGLGVTPRLVAAYLQCAVAANGYAVGQRILVNPHMNTDNAGSRGQALIVDATNVYVSFASASTNTYAVINWGTGNLEPALNTSWRLVVVAYA